MQRRSIGCSYKAAAGNSLTLKVVVNLNKENAASSSPQQLILNKFGYEIIKPSRYYTLRLTFQIDQIFADKVTVHLERKTVVR